MPRSSLTLTTVLGLGVVLVLLWLLNQSAAITRAAAELHVCPPPDCPHATIQQAVDAAQHGDVIKVAGGTYVDAVTRARPAGYGSTGTITQVVYINKTLSLQGGYTDGDWTTPDPTAHPTILDAQGQGRGIAVIGDVTVIIQGLDITGGDAAGQGGIASLDAGGGIYVLSATVTLVDSAIYANTAAHYGGGIYLNQSPQATIGSSTISSNIVTSTGPGSGWGGGMMISFSPSATIVANTFSGNTAGFAGGGVYAFASDGMALRGNTFAANAAQQGGGIHLRGSDGAAIGADLLSQGNLFQANTASEQGGGLVLIDSDDVVLNDNHIASNTAGADGGGLCLLGNGNAIVRGNHFSDNLASVNGGGLYLVGGTLTTWLDSNVIVSNTAAYGGGAYLDGSANVIVHNTVVAVNRATVDTGGLYLVAISPHFLHTTVADNTGNSGIHVASGGAITSSLSMTNTILSGHTTGVNVEDGCAADLNGVLWYNTPTPIFRSGSATVLVRNQYTGDPAFLDPVNGDYHLSAKSAAIDKGLTTDIATDLDGENRPFHLKPDLGADEWSELWRIYVPLVQRNHARE